MENKNFLLELSAEAEQDFDNSYNYYFSKSNDIANLFYNQINSALSSIKEYPYLYQKVFANIHKFTFSIYYQIQTALPGLRPELYRVIDHSLKKIMGYRKTERPLCALYRQH